MLLIQKLILKIQKKIIMNPNIKTIATFVILFLVIFFNKNSYSSPVELSYFTYFVFQNNVTLQWGTLSEVINERFDIERKETDSTSWIMVGSVPGNGTTNKPHDYQFNDSGLSFGYHNYRLKQVDFNGNFIYHDLNDTIIILTPAVLPNGSVVSHSYHISQNYPNPFNPVTNLEFGIPKLGFVSLKVYDLVGNEVKTLVNEIKPAGSYSVTFDGSNLSSGIYFYKITADDFSSVKKMTLVK